MDYPYRAALASALSYCDEAVIVVGPSVDGTLDAMYAAQAEHGTDRVKVIEREWAFDRTWQERVWAWGAEQTSAEWLHYVDFDEAIHEDGAPIIRRMMETPGVHLIDFPYVHLYGTPRWRECRNFYKRNTRLGRRDTVNYRMVNWCTDKTPNHAVCAMVATIGGQDVNAHLWAGPERATPEIPMIHYGWVRDARALAVSQAKHFAWYANGAGLEDGHIPDVEPYPFNMTGMRVAGMIEPYAGPHPAVMSEWYTAHAAGWAALDAEMAGVAA
jgi:hypothetical protein